MQQKAPWKKARKYYSTSSVVALVDDELRCTYILCTVLTTALGKQSRSSRVISKRHLNMAKRPLKIPCIHSSIGVQTIDLHHHFVQCRYINVVVGRVFRIL